MYSMNKTEIENEKQADAARRSNPGDEPLAPIDPGTVTPEQLAELKDRAAKADENWERLLRISADLENFKKRASREKQDAIKFANEGLLQKLIPVLDNFDAALSAAQSAQTEVVQSLQT